MSDGKNQTGGKLDVSVRVFPVQDSKTILATASVTIGGCFAIRGVRIMDSEKGAFVAMPSRKDSKGEYRDVCFPTTPEMRKALDTAVMGEYQKTMEQSYSRAGQAMEKRASVLGDLQGKAAESKAAPAPDKPKTVDHGAR